MKSKSKYSIPTFKYPKCSLGTCKWFVRGPHVTCMASKLVGMLVCDTSFISHPKISITITDAAAPNGSSKKKSSNDDDHMRAHG